MTEKISRRKAFGLAGMTAMALPLLLTGCATGIQRRQERRAGRRERRAARRAGRYERRQERRY
jgi:hypothetical protein